MYIHLILLQAEMAMMEATRQLLIQNMSLIGQRQLILMVLIQNLESILMMVVIISRT